MDQLQELDDVADELESMHKNTRVGSLVGSSFGAAGGIMSIAGVCLAPFILGASLALTGAGVVAVVAGGVTGAASNITNMVKQKTLRENIVKIINELQTTIKPMLKLLRNINNITEGIKLVEQTLKKHKNQRSARDGSENVFKILGVASLAILGKTCAEAAKEIRVFVKAVYAVRGSASAARAVRATAEAVKEVPALVDSCQDCPYLQRQADAGGYKLKETHAYYYPIIWQLGLRHLTLLHTIKDVLRELADGLEIVHFNTTVSSLTGGVVGLAGGITSVVGLILAPFTLGASLIVTGLGIGVAVAGGVTSGVSNITNMVNQRTDRQKKKFQEKNTSTICCIQNIQIAVETLEKGFSTSNSLFPNAQAGTIAGARLGRGLGGIPELLRLIEVVNVGKVAAQAVRVVRVAETATGVLSALFVAVDVFFVFLDSREIHKLRQDYALRESQRESESTSNQTTGSTEKTSDNSDTADLLPADTQQAEELKSETMTFVTKIKETTGASSNPGYTTRRNAPNVS
ncbi:unnamed protein product [Leuciscus chuanchicus]